MIQPEEFKKIRHYCHQHSISFLPDSQDVKDEGTPFLVLYDRHLETWYPSCYSVQEARNVCREIARQRSIMDFSDKGKQNAATTPAS